MDNDEQKSASYLYRLLQDRQNENYTEEVINFDKVINNDGLTLGEVFQVLVQMLKGDLDLLKKVLGYAEIMVKHGTKVAKESQLSKSVVHNTLHGIIINTQNHIKIPSSTPSAQKIITKNRRNA